MARGTVRIDGERCKGCDLCTTVCPQHVLILDEARLNAKGYHPAKLNDPNGECTGCAICSVMCPDVCITVYREPLKRVDVVKREVMLHG